MINMGNYNWSAESSTVEKTDLIKTGYKKGIKDAISAIADMFHIDIGNGQFDRITNMIASDEIGIQEALTSIGIVMGDKCVNADDLIDYSESVDNIARFIIDNTTRNDLTNDDDLYDLYSVFVDVFEKISFAFDEEISDYVKCGGYKLYGMIALTYITLRTLYKSGFVEKKISMAKTTDFFDQKSWVIKRIIGRLRDRYSESMDYIESDEMGTDTIYDATDKIRISSRQ